MRGLAFATWVLLVGCGRIGFAEHEATPDGAAGSGFSQLVAYANQTCAVFDGKARCWGSNVAGQLGDGSRIDRAVPTKVALPPGAVTRISQGEKHACAIVKDRVYCWGDGFAAEPTQVAFSAPATDVGCGRDFTCVIADTTQCWGVNDAHQLGDASLTNRTTPGPIDSATRFTSLVAGDDHACASVAGSPPQCWGHNDDGALGTGSLTLDSAGPGPVIGGITTQPRIAGWHACALEQGEVWCWGRNADGELGDGTTVPTATPQRVPGLAGVTAIATGGGPTDRDATCAITGGQIACWGVGLEGRLGNGSTGSSPVPVPVVGVPAPAVSVAIGYDHACVLTIDEDIYCWGRGTEGQLGDGLLTSSLTPVRVIR